MAVNDLKTALILSVLLVAILKALLARIKPKAKGSSKYLAAGGTIQRGKLKN